MKFVFINPNRSIEKTNIWNVINSLFPPLGLAMLSAVLEREGFEADIIDAWALDLDIEGILSRVDHAADMIGITSTTVEIDDAVELARAIRRRFPNAKILMGGVHPTVFHDTLVGDGVCDMVIRGEGEEAVVYLARGAPLREVSGLTWRSTEGEVVANPRQDQYADIDSLPMPSYHKLPMNRYHSALGAAKRSPSIGLVTSRGCPGKCTFCYSGMHGRRIRLISAEKVLEQIVHLKNEYGIKEISFYDDTFTASRKRVEKLCNMMLSEGLDMAWSCFARVDSVDPEILVLMRRAGCHQISFGFESADEDILGNINKRVNAASYSDVISWTKAAGIDVRGTFMLGNPGETEQSMRKTIEYSKKAGIQFAIYNITTPFPGTAMYEQAVRDGLLEHTRWGLYDLSHPLLRLPTVPADIIQAYYYRAYRQFYFRPSYILRRLFSIRSAYEIKTHMLASLGIISTIFSRRDGT
jgi:radical SAM superfamily enzyme YgiQ (UPF0313 family)